MKTAIRITILPLLLTCIWLFPAAAQAGIGVLPGAEGFSFKVANQDGSPVTQAGSHPYQVVTNIVLNRKTDSAGETVTDGSLRNVNVVLPPGLIGNQTAITECTDEEFHLHQPYPLEPEFTNASCPDSSQIGLIDAETSSELLPGGLTLALFNLVPPRGVPAEFGANVEGVPILITPKLRSDGDYGFTIGSDNISQALTTFGARVTFWGVPADHSHDGLRGPCLTTTLDFEGPTGRLCPVSGVPKAFLTMPTSCVGAFDTTLLVSSWPTLTDPSGESAERTVVNSDAEGNPVGLDGCNRLSFDPSISAAASTDRASAPSGLDFNINFDDPGLINAEGVAQSQMKKVAVTLPEGFTINPSAGVGLGGCTPADYVRETVNSAPGAGCPNDSKLGSVTINTPLLSTAIQGSLFIAAPHDNPFDSLVALYIVAKDPNTGILIKLAGKVIPDPVTGQLTATFDNNPQLAFDHFNFHFREGQQAPLISPALCGTYTTQADLSPWSNPTATVTDTSSFTITKGFDGGACPSGGIPPFTPQLQAGTLNGDAGSYSPFYLHLSRTDAEQEIAGFSTTLPVGLTGNLSGVPFCPEASVALARTKTGAEETNSPSCPVASEVGHTLVGTGVGAVLAYVPGKVYLAGPYHGDPFSIVSVTSAVVGPFDLGTVVVRFGLKIDPYTAQVSVDSRGSDQIPRIIDGIVTHVRDIRVYIDRTNFTLNPTNCDPLQITSTLASNLGQNASVSTRFEAANCRALQFKPGFSVSTSGKTSRVNGASLRVRLAYPKGPEANVSKVKVDLPKQLPSRLTTLQKACTAVQFERNPAGCPAASIVGHARAVTPILPVPLEGPAYFVSYGGAKFPSLIVVLQGYGVTVNLVGATFISKKGITSSTFESVPDVPVGTFELTLPQGKYSALAANGNLCKTKLAMPTAFTAQNGAVIKRSTKINVTGCPKVKNAKKHKAKRKHH